MFLRDFTLSEYEGLLTALIQNGYRSWIPYEPSGSDLSPKGLRAVILRHDVDKPSPVTLRFAELENRLGLKSIYYFRAWNGRFEEDVISRILLLNHEVGYHYETLSKAAGDRTRAIGLFQKELSALRRLAPVKTACMHGAPLSRWDNKTLWESYDYRDLGIKFEPYFDLNFEEVFYLTDTGRRWDGHRANIRDRVKTGIQSSSKTTADLIRALSGEMLPPRLMINTHPHRWDDRPVPWVKELFWQNLKNLGKSLLSRLRR